jgi:CheY-like chemotaxis protein
MMLMVGPLCVKIRHSDINTTVIENFAISSGAKTILPSVLDFCGSLKMKISPLCYCNKLAHVHQRTCVVTWHHRSFKESLDHDEDYHGPDDPAKISPNRIAKGPDNAQEPAEKTSINVLLVDDDQDILFTFKSILEAEGYHIEAFADPNEALSHFIQMDPSYYSLILTDIQMPNCNGFQLYQKLREINIDIRVIFMTAFDVPGNLLDTMPAINESDIIKKPIEEEHFVSRIKKAIKLE